MTTVISGTWSAFSSGGVTYYISGGSTISGPVNLAAGTILNVSSGAVVSGLTDTAAGAVINISSGGTVQNSTTTAATITVSAGGSLLSNTLVGGPVTVNSGGKLAGNTYTSSTLLVNSGASISGSTIGAGETTTILGGATATSLTVASGGTVIAASGTLAGFTAAAGGTISSGSAVYSGLVAPNGATETALILSGTWSAVASGGATVYQSGGSTVTGAVALGAGTTLNISSGAVVSNLTDGSNTLDTINVLAGGELLSSKIDNGYLNVASGGLTSGNLLNSDVETLGAGTRSVNDTYTNTYDGDVTLVSSGASVTGATVTSGGHMTVFSGGSVAGLSVGSSGVAIVSSGASLSSLSIATGGSAYVATTLNSTGTPTVATPTGGTVVTGAWNAELVGGKTVYVSGTQTVSGAIHLSGGSLTVQSGAIASGVYADATGGLPSIYVQQGGELLSSVIDNGFVYVSAGGLTSGNLLDSDVETVGSGAVSVNDIYANSYDANTVTVANGGKVVGAVIENNNNLVVNSGGEISVAEITSGGTLNVLTGGIYDTCYLGGTMIRMQDGEKPVEAIRPGDSVLACVDGVAVARPVVWVGRREVGPVAGRPRATTDFPVRVRRNALADGVPARDLLITPEHCLYLDGGFVPVRMLVNGASIVHDTDFVRYEYFHVETASHAVVWADGALSETYLDTGNRQDFLQSGLISINGKAKSWSEHAAAPLHTDPVLLETLFRRLQARALALDLAPSAAAMPELTTDPDLRVQLPSGRILQPRAEKNGRFSVAIPAGTDTVVLLSRSARPSEVVGPFMDDRRLLGVRVGRMELFEQLELVGTSPHLSGTDARGWHGFEGAESRWTDGAAELLFGRRLSQPGLLVLEIVAGGPYPVEGSVAEAPRLTA